VGALMHVGGYLGVWAVLTRRAGFVDLPLWKTSVGSRAWRLHCNVPGPGCNVSRPVASTVCSPSVWWLGASLWSRKGRQCVRISTRMCGCA